MFEVPGSHIRITTNEGVPCITHRRKFLLLVGSTLALAAIPALAQAKLLQVTGQNSTITPSSAVTNFLAAHNVHISAVGPATISGGSLTLPVVGGTMKTPKLNEP